MSPRDRILARRAKFLAAATAAAAVGAACSAGPDNSSVCLLYPADSGAEAQACLSSQYDAGADTADTRPQACLSPELDSSTADTSDSSDSASDTSVADTFPMPCLVPPLDSGS